MPIYPTLKFTFSEAHLQTKLSMCHVNEYKMAAIYRPR